MTRRAAPRNRLGFSLVEVALALLVVGVGLLTVFGLFPSGLDSNRRSIQETHMALFADYALNGFRAMASAVDWAEVKEGSAEFSLQCPSPDMWAGAGSIDIVTGPGAKPIVFKPVAMPAIEEMSLRYEVRIGLVQANNPFVKFIQVKVWPGAFGAPTGGLTYYTEVYAYRK